MEAVTIRGIFNQTAGTLDDDNGLSTSPASLTIGGTLNASYVESDGSLTVIPGGIINNSDSDLTLGGGSRTYLGSVATPGGTINLAAGTAVDVNGGLLDNNGSIIGGPVNVNYGAEAIGAGSYQSVVVNRGGTFHPGNSPGTATVTDYTFGPGSSFEFDIDNADGTHGSNWSLLNASGTVSITATFSPNDQAIIDIDSLTASDSPGDVVNFNPTQSYTWDFVDAAGISGFSPADFAVDTSGFSNGLDGGSFSVVPVGNDLDLQFTPAGVPEPASVWMVAVAGSLLLRRRRSALHERFSNRRQSHME